MRPTPGIAAAAVLGLLGAWAPGLREAGAAVAVCKPILAGQPAEAANETEAKRQALASWLEGAGKHGIEYTRWQLAYNRLLSCDRVAGGLFRCTAVGRPCALTPPRLLGPDTAPLPRGAGPARQEQDEALSRGR